MCEIQERLRVSPVNKYVHFCAIHHQTTDVNKISITKRFNSRPAGLSFTTACDGVINEIAQHGLRNSETKSGRGVRKKFTVEYLIM